MPWFFLPESVVPVDEATRALIAHRPVIPAVPHTIIRPREERGTAFEVEAYDLALRCLGLDHLSFAVSVTDNPTIQCLTKQTRQRKRAADVAPRGVRTGAEAFVEHFLSLQEHIGAEQEEAVAELQAERDRAQRAFFEAQRRYTDAVERLTIQEGRVNADAAALAKEYEASIADERVTKVSTTQTQLIIETTPLTLASAPPRFIGRYRVTVGLTDGSVAVASIDRLNSVYPHPNVSKEGIPYLNTLRDAVLRRLGTHEIAVVVRQLLDFLEEPPIGITVPEMQPERWPAVPTPLATVHDGD
ncbi:hypothetical protein HY480_03815 [Candidatus Uhrbacteria bacterium]|nr:hypothetical protein [Candidatus Uhrbacteria bacterium]